MSVASPGYGAVVRLTGFSGPSAAMRMPVGLMEAAMELARREGADYMDLGTSEDDLVARRLYESLGFSNREGKADGPVNYYYEREL